jgi:4-hydroxythreonine-4-phosphate dehydrogenase
VKYLGITMGDPAGIGPEISLKVLEKNKEYRECSIIYGSISILEYYKEKLKLKDIKFNIIKNTKEFKKDYINVIQVFDIDMKDITIGKVSGLCGEAAYKYIERAIQDALQGDIAVVITAPINKEALNKGGYHYEGHTEIFAKLTNTKKYAMLLWSEKLSVVHVSTHCSLQDACRKVTKDRVLNVIELAGKFLQQLGVKEPRIAVAGLNPHSGEAGLFGTEEIEHIIPALNQAKKDNWKVEGPIPPDTVFLKAYRKEYDVVVAMYHDQGHIPIKLLAFDEGVNVTLGLPIIRTSVDHGTAFDIAGKGIASEKSILNALILGKKFF